MKFNSTLLAIVLFVLSAPVGYAQSRIVVSLKPIHSLVAGITAGTEVPALLLDGAASPHGYALKPSQVGMLEGANLVIRVAPELESFLNKPLRTVVSNAEVMTLIDIPGLTIHTLNEEDHHHDDHASMQINDPHIWLDPRNVAVIIDAVRDRLIALNPKHEAVYRKNTALMRQRLQQLDTEIRTLLEPVRTRHYMVFHNAYQYFSRRYGLRDGGVISNNPEVPSSVTEVQQAQGYLHDHNVQCVFIEPQFPSNRVEALRENASIRVETLDPLGAGLTPDPELYFTLLKNLARNMQNCLEV